MPEQRLNDEDLALIRDLIDERVKNAQPRYWGSARVSAQPPVDGQGYIWDEDKGKFVPGNGTLSENHGPSQHTEGNAWKDTYQDASGDETEIALGASGTYKRSTGAASAPAYSAIQDADVPATHSGSAHHAAVTASGAHTMSGQDITAVAASTTLAAHIELATVGEILAGTDLTRALSPGGVAGVVQNARWTFAADAEASDAYVITLTPTLANYFVGMLVWFTANTANTGAATLNINSVGAQTIKKHHDQDLADGDIEAGAVVGVVWDGTNWQMVSQLGNAPAAGHTEDHDHDGSPTQQLLAANTHQTISGVSASTTAQGHVELATAAETTTGTDATRAITPDGFQDSSRNIRMVDFRLVEQATDVSVATDLFGDWVCPWSGTIIQDDANPYYFCAWTDTAGTTGTMVVDVHLNGTTIMTTNKLDIETAEKSTGTAATQPDLTTTSVTAGDIFTFDVDAIHTTAAKGLVVRLAIRPT